MRIAGMLMAAAMAASLGGGAAAQEEAAALPEVEAPDFAEPDAVLASVADMLASIEGVRDAEGWKALRAIDECETVEDLIEGQVTATAYDAAGGERLWRLCHGRYQGLKLH